MSTYQYIVGDSRNVDRIFKERDIGQPDLIMTSPPYFNIKNYENSDQQIGLRQSYEEYLRDLRDIFQECYELSSPHASFWMIADTVKVKGIMVPLPFDINQELSRSSSPTWKLKETIIWNKLKNIPWHSKGCFKNHFEYIFLYVKDRKYKFNVDSVREISDLKKWWLTYPERYNPKGKAPSNVWEFTTPIRGWGKSYLNHFCPFPFPLVEKILSLSTDENDSVFDPFAGSGSVLATAYVMNRDSVGIDINREYKKRFMEETLVGAKKYWLRRKRELMVTRQKIKQFVLINNKLRKNKLSAMVSERATYSYARKGDYVLVLENAKDEKMIDCIIIGDESAIDTSLLAQDGEIQELTNVFGIGINWMVSSRKDAVKLLRDTTLYKYKLGNVHEYIYSVTLEEMIGDINRNEHFYSSIALSISKPDALF